MKTKDHSRQVKGQVVEKFEAGIGSKTNKKKDRNFQTSHQALVNSLENGKSVAQLQTRAARYLEKLVLIWNYDYISATKIYCVLHRR